MVAPIECPTINLGFSDIELLKLFTSSASIFQDKPPSVGKAVL
jgi:hypothetical protein